MKICGRCKKEKPFEDFALSKNKGYQSYCKKCNSEHKKEWITTNRVKVRWNIIWSKYRLRPEDWQRMWDEQDGLCRICREVQPTQVDHNHSCCSGPTSCGKCVRSLLCGRCNLKLAFVENNSKLIDLMREYIIEHENV